MRLTVSILVFGFFLCAGSFATGAHADPEFGALSDPEAEKHLAGIEKPERRFQLPRSTSVKGLPHVQRVRIRGTLTDTDIQSLLTLSGYHRSTVYQIVGDGQYARVSAGTFCGSLCGSGSDLVFRKDPTGWVYLYAHEWIS